MARFITIISTIIKSNDDLLFIKLVIDKMRCITRWTHDVEDCDKVLRIVSTENICNELIEELNHYGINASEMAVFDNHYLTNLV